MAINVRPFDREQLFLMPPSVSEWLPHGHLAWFVLDVVAELDLAGFYAGHREDGRGGAVYDPGVMLAVHVYAYCVGERSSRRIERRLVEDVAFRVVAANQCPDHATLARFRGRHQDAIADLFSQVLGLCVARVALPENSKPAESHSHFEWIYSKCESTRSAAASDLQVGEPDAPAGAALSPTRRRVHGRRT